VLSTLEATAFQSGAYLDYTVRGNVVITVTKGAGTSNVLSGLFLDPVSTAAATYVRRDTTTQGNWMGTYGAQGYDVIDGATSLPGYASITPSGANGYVWASSSSDPRALQVPGQTGRIAATWWTTTSFTVDVDLTDGQVHDLELYFLDWDKQGRVEQVQISNATTGAVLSTQTVSSFQSGVYFDYAVSGNILITITDVKGTSNVLSGLFLDAAPSSDHADQLGAEVSIDTESPSTPSMAGAAIARGSSGGLTIAPAAGPVDAVLGVLADDDDATAPAAGSSIHDLAMEQVAETSNGRTDQPSMVRLSDFGGRPVDLSDSWDPGRGRSDSSRTRRTGSRMKPASPIKASIPDPIKRPGAAVVWTGAGNPIRAMASR
jgi:hypothetical protein